jgi:hypothetical protein
MDWNRRRFLGTIGGLLLAGCAAARVRPTPTVEDTPPVTAVLPNADLAVGRNRFLLGLLDAQNRPITDAQVHLRFYFLGDPAPRVRTESDAIFRGDGLGDRGLYVATVEFPEPGLWGVEVLARRPAQALPPTRWQFTVQPQSQTPPLGAAAIPSRNPTVHTVDDPARLCSAVPPCPLHDRVIADVLAQGRPLALYFGTPGYCVSRVCGPALAVVLALWEAYRDRADFIHIEIYTDPATRTLAPTVQEWRLPSEPWLFLIDRQGRVAEKFEASITRTEVEPALIRLLA